MTRYFAVPDQDPEVARWFEYITDRKAFRQSLPPTGAELHYDCASQPVEM